MCNREMAPAPMVRRWMATAVLVDATSRIVVSVGFLSRIAKGLPVGGELEYSDQATIARALAGRATM